MLLQYADHVLLKCRELELITRVVNCFICKEASIGSHSRLLSARFARAGAGDHREAGGQAAQHADAGLHEAREAEAHRAGDARGVRAPRPPARHVQNQGELSAHLLVLTEMHPAAVSLHTNVTTIVSVIVTTYKSVLG